MLNNKGVIKLVFYLFIGIVVIAILGLLGILFFTDIIQNVGIVENEGPSILDDPNYGRCSHTWSDDAGTITLGYNEAEEAKIFCKNEINPDKCAEIDIYNKATNRFRSQDGIPDCMWN